MQHPNNNNRKKKETKQNIITIVYSVLNKKKQIRMMNEMTK